jgi:hypothetical protein
LIDQINPQLMAAQLSTKDSPMFLLAQDPTFDWSDIMLRQGPLVVVFLLVVGFTIWYGRRLAEGHIELVGTLKDNAVKSDGYQARTTVALEKLTETQQEIVRQSKDFKCRHP